MNGGASITQGRYEASGSSLPNDRKMSNFKLLGQTVAPGQALSPMNKNTNFPIQVMQLISEQAEDRSELNFAIFTQKQVNHDWAPKDQMARVLYYGHFGKFAFGVAADAAQANENAPIRTLLKGDTLYYTKDKKGNICIHTKIPGDGTPYIELNGDKVLKAQREVQVWRANDVGDEALERMLNTKKG
jgi:hypothetical protein